jgi:hypothetical protein
MVKTPASTVARPSGVHSPLALDPSSLEEHPLNASAAMITARSESLNFLLLIFINCPFDYLDLISRTWQSLTDPRLRNDLHCTWSSPGAPHRGGGLPSSQPGPYEKRSELELVTWA